MYSLDIYSKVFSELQQLFIFIQQLLICKGVAKEQQIIHQVAIETSHLNLNQKLAVSSAE